VDREMISSKKDGLFSSHIDKIRMVDGAREFLDDIYRHGHKMAIVTNCNRATAEHILSYLQLDRFFDTVIIGSECTRAKPYPDPYVQGMRFFGVAADRVVIFEDSKTGILSAQGVSGRCVVGIQTLYSAKELLDIGVDRTIENYIGLSYRDILEYQNMNVNTLKRHIMTSMEGWNILEIHVNEEKLKGGFISDVIALDIVRRIEEISVVETVHCVLKLESKNETFLSKMSNDLALYEREYYFYENVSKFVPLKIPEFYGLVYDEKFENIGILMKNMAHDGRFDLNLDLNTVGIDVALRVISSMAKMHVKFWGLDLQKKFPDLKKHDDPLFFPSWGDFVRDRWPIFLDKWSYLLTKEQIGLAKDIVSRFDDIQLNMSDRNLTLCHGDVKSANIFYERCQNGSYEPYFIDWQYTIIGKGVQDLVFFMIESFDIDVIRKYRTVFMEYYFLKLLEYGVKDYSWVDFERDFKTATCYFPFFVAIWFGTVSDDELIDKNFPVFFIQKFFAFTFHN
jgi:HAD superfamily hydrolase (TIGR01509 family)